MKCRTVKNVRTVRMILKREGKVIEQKVQEGETYESALLACNIIPDTVLIFYNGKSLPQDKVIEEEEVEIEMTCSRG
ncbi:MAG: thiamine S protein [Euryarchaeota archaeon]|nr:thiamine S protein [Euryarchaeota archaeon]